MRPLFRFSFSSLSLLPGLPFAIALGALPACSSSSNGSSSLNGTVDGISFSVASGIAEVGPESSSSSCSSEPDGGQTCTSSSSGQVIAVALTNRAGISCGTLTGQGTRFANLDVLELAVGTASGTVATGTYQIVGGNITSGAEALLLTTSSTCGQGLDITATTGSITLSQILGQQRVGHVQRHVRLDGHLHGLVRRAGLRDPGQREHDVGRRRRGLPAVGEALSGPPETAIPVPSLERMPHAERPERRACWFSHEPCGSDFIQLSEGNHHANDFAPRPSLEVHRAAAPRARRRRRGGMRVELQQRRSPRGRRRVLRRSLRDLHRHRQPHAHPLRAHDRSPPARRRAARPTRRPSASITATRWS